MSLKDILVHVDTTAAGEARLQFAVHLAQRVGAYLSGVFVLPPPDPPIVAPEVGPVVVDLTATLAALEREAHIAEEKFKATLERDAVQGEWHRERGPAATMVSRRARAADLVILGQFDPDHPGGLDTPEDVVFSCGRPVLLVPYAGRFERVGESVLAAWNGTREATRALHDALPLMTPSKSLVTILSVNPGPESAPDEALVLHLERHGLKAKKEIDVVDEIDVADDILSRTMDLGADLIVMGAYSHSRLRELILGGTTQAILEHMTVPVLMSR